VPDIARDTSGYPAPAILDGARRFPRSREPETQIAGAGRTFDVPLVDLDTGEALDRALISGAEHRGDPLVVWVRRIMDLWDGHEWSGR